jgi:hypothetical protein
MTMTQNVNTTISSDVPAAQQPLKVKAVLLSTFLDKHFDGDPLAMSKATGITSSQINRWLEKSAVMIDNAVYLRASKFPENERKEKARITALTKGTTGVPFMHHLHLNHRGRQTDFAEFHGIYQQQANRWTKRNCVFLRGQVYREQREINFAADKASKGVVVH